MNTTWNLHRSVAESVLCFSFTVWYGHLTKKDKNKLNEIVKSAKRLVAESTSLDDMYNRLVMKQTEKIMSDANHPLHDN